MIWRFRGREMSFERTRIMAILNVTPDSFSDGGKYFSREAAVQTALEMEHAGADIIDIGGESTRPGASPVSPEEEMERTLPVIREIRRKSQIPLSIDTTKPETARAALEAGADIINDVDGLHAAKGMAAVAREFEAGLVLMHRRGDPETMQQFTQYEEVVEKVFEELNQSFREVSAAGVVPDQIVLDPGIGFSKSAEQSLELLAGLRRFQSWGRPVLVGPSRKSFLGALTGTAVLKSPRERDWGTAAAVALTVAAGASMVRVHNVEAMKDVVRVAEAIVRREEQSHVRS